MTKNNIYQYQLNNDLTASDNLKFEFSYDQATGKHGYLDSQGTFVPFKSPTGNKDITISNTGTTSGIDVSDYATASITTSGLYKPSGTYNLGTYTTNGTKSPTTDLSAYKNVSFTVNVPTFDYTYYGVGSSAQGGQLVVSVMNNTSSTILTSDRFVDSNVSISINFSSYIIQIQFLEDGYRYSNGSWVSTSKNYSFSFALGTGVGLRF